MFSHSEANADEQEKAKELGDDEWLVSTLVLFAVTGLKYHNLNMTLFAIPLRFEGVSCTRRNIKIADQ